MKKNKVLVVAVHPDDETLGCGGTLLRHRSEGDEIFWLIVTDIKPEDGFSEKKILERHKQIQSVVKKYRFKNIFCLNIPTMKVDTVPMADLIGMIGGVIKDIQPTILYIPFKGDVHSDHRKVFDA